MTAKKFPTPNLDALPFEVWPNNEVAKAVQADIALAVEADRASLLTFAPDLKVTIGTDVEAARVTVPDGVREFVENSLFDLCAGTCREGEKCSQAQERAMLSDWLESLTVAPKEAPVFEPTSADVTVSYLGKIIGSYEVKAEAPAPVEKRCGTCAHWEQMEYEDGKCVADFPASCTEEQPMEEGWGTSCPCWKAKP